MVRWLRLSAVCVFVLTLFFLRAAPAAARAVLLNGLEETLESVPSDSMVPVLISFFDPPDPYQLRKEVSDMSLPDRRAYVTDVLKYQLEESGGDAIRWIENEGKKGRAEHLNPLWIAHGYVCRIRADRLPIIADHPQVESIMLDPPIRLEDCIDEAPVTETEPVPMDLSWGLNYIGAPDLWDMGYEGRGVIVGIVSTGVDIEHPDLADHIWINEDEIPDNGVDDDANGYVDDVYGWNFYNDNNNISDAHGHGTKCAGLICGDGTGGDTTGVAPDVTLMVVRNWASNWSSEATRALAVQYLVDNGAQVISASISYEHGFDNFDIIHRDSMVNTLITGVIMVNSQGNNGDGDQPLNINAPARCPPPWIHPEQTLVGGTSAMLGIGAFSSDGLVASFSGRGPTEWYADFYPEDYRDYPYQNGAQMGLIKPDILAPRNANTTNRGGGYISFNGESAATPHVAGALGLLLSIHQQATPAELTEALKMSAEDGGDPGLDNVYGAGRLRIDLAHEYLDEMFDYGGLQATVTDIIGNPVPDARVELNNNEVRGWSGADGVALLDRVLPGTYVVRIYAEGYALWTDIGIEVTEGEVTELEATLSGTGVQVTPASVNTVLAPDDTLDVEFSVMNPDEETYEVDVLLQPSGGLDWDADLQVPLDLTLGTLEARGVAVVGSTVTVCGSRPGGDYLVWRLSLDGVLIDSLAQPERFAEGVQDLATTRDGRIIAGFGDMLFTLDTDWNIIDSLQTTVDNIRCVAFDEAHGTYYLSGGDLNMIVVDSLGNMTGSYELPITPTGLAFNPDDRYGPAVYTLELAGAGLAQLSRVNLETGEVSTLVDLAPGGFDIASALDIEDESAKPFQRVVVLQLGSGVRLFDREVESRAYDVTESFTLPPGGADVPFSLYGPRLIPGSIVDLDLVFSDEDGLWTRTVPIIIEPINYVVGGGDENALPLGNELLPPYPNPFNATVQIGYRLAAPAEVRLAVFNVLGREVAVLDQGQKATGTYRVAWDARDMATGVYVAVLQANNERIATKMLLVR